MVKLQFEQKRDCCVHVAKVLMLGRMIEGVGSVLEYLIVCMAQREKVMELALQLGRHLSSHGFLLKFLS